MEKIVVWGSKYKFSQHDKKLLSKYRVKFLSEDKEELFKELATPGKKILVLNTSKEEDILLKLREHEDIYKNRVNILYINEFLEKFLSKCYIPEDFKEKIPELEALEGYTSLQYLIKRIMDFLIVIPLSILSVPILIYSAYRIKKESPEGPILFKQKRVGLNGEEFVCYKLRSMVPDAEKDGPKFASENDPRVFKWGETMRKLRIDEIPQIWNVIRGEMHVIGPRPERKYWVSQFEKKIPYYSKRHLIKPGITGWAQVMYPYGATLEDAKQKLMYDLFYIKNWSIRQEIKTIFKTILIVLRRQGR